MLKIVNVIGKRQAKKFINFPLKLDKGTKEFMPFVYEDEGKVFELANTLLYEGMKNAISNVIEYTETSPQCEYNILIQNLWRKFDSVNHKKRVGFLGLIA